MTLTSRQREILTLAAEGFTQPEIGARLYLSIDTVATHVKAARAILGARTSAHAVAIGITRGLITLHPDAPGGTPA